MMSIYISELLVVSDWNFTIFMVVILWPSGDELLLFLVRVADVLVIDTQCLNLATSYIRCFTY